MHNRQSERIETNLFWCACEYSYSFTSFRVFFTSPDYKCSHKTDILSSMSLLLVRITAFFVLCSCTSFSCLCIEILSKCYLYFTRTDLRFQQSCIITVLLRFTFYLFVVFNSAIEEPYSLATTSYWFISFSVNLNNASYTTYKYLFREHFKTLQKHLMLSIQLKELMSASVFDGRESFYSDKQNEHISRL